MSEIRSRMRFGAVLLASTALVACGEILGEQTYTTVAKATSDSYTLELLTTSKFHTGLTPVYLQLKGPSGVIMDATMKFEPMMTMVGMDGKAGMTHSTPTFPVELLSLKKLYRANTVFSMPSSDMGTWNARVTATLPGGAPLVFDFKALNIADNKNVKIYSPQSGSKEKHILSFNFDKEKPVVGENPVTMTVHSTEDNQSFQAVTDADLKFTQIRMLGMDHGTGAPINPVRTVAGMYAGKLALVMVGGQWEVTIEFLRVEVNYPNWPYVFDS